MYSLTWPHGHIKARGKKSTCSHASCLCMYTQRYHANTHIRAQYCVHTHTNTHTHTHTHTHTRRHACMHTHAHTCIRMYVHARSVVIRTHILWLFRGRLAGNVWHTSLFKSWCGSILKSTGEICTNQTV